MQNGLACFCTQVLSSQVLNKGSGGIIRDRRRLTSIVTMDVKSCGFTIRDSSVTNHEIVTWIEFGHEQRHEFERNWNKCVLNSVVSITISQFVTCRKLGRCIQR